MAGKSRMKSYRPQVMIKIKNITEKELEAFAFQVEAQTKVNIQQNGQIDTGFMLNSVYTRTKSGESTYNDTETSGLYISKDLRDVEREIAPEREIPGKATAIVAVGAAYAIYQEQQQSFLFAAAETTASGRPGAEVSSNIKKRVREDAE